MILTNYYQQQDRVAVSSFLLIFQPLDRVVGVLTTTYDSDLEVFCADDFFCRHRGVGCYNHHIMHIATYLFVYTTQTALCTVSG